MTVVFETYFLLCSVRVLLTGSKLVARGTFIKNILLIKCWKNSVSQILRYLPLKLASDGYVSNFYAYVSKHKAIVIH